MVVEGDGSFFFPEVDPDTEGGERFGPSGNADAVHQGGQVPVGEVRVGEGLTKGGEVNGRQGEGAVLDEGGSSGDRMAILGELGVEGVEDFIVVEGQDGPLARGTLLGGQLIESTEIEDTELPNFVPRSAGFGYRPVVMPIGEGPFEVHGFIWLHNE